MYICRYIYTDIGLCVVGRTCPPCANEHSAPPSTFVSSACRRFSRRRALSQTSARGTPPPSRTCPMYAPLRPVPHMYGPVIQHTHSYMLQCTNLAHTYIYLWARDCPFDRIHIRTALTSRSRRHRPSPRRLADVLRCGCLQRGHRRMEHRGCVEYVPGMRHFAVDRLH